MMPSRRYTVNKLAYLVVRLDTQAQRLSGCEGGAVAGQREPRAPTWASAIPLWGSLVFAGGHGRR